ncbi:hypothetical protein IG193_08220 [Infirmifilum lucidum]|uniref:TMEM198/TM7SF3 family protein n=1 Tax=Infirmifilum lucidum TaxID=2776706 RepID=A0A7L9FGG9_9CREN|nr:hypothetical protein [Infirmifilum lucidum]QOJ78721.1 hypothetical protein IG193_08220 [Infirmifilum lucidum]
MSPIGFWDSAILVLLGVITAFWGVKFARLLASLVFGLAMGYVFYAYSTPALKATLLPLVLFLLGFVVGAMIGFSAFKLVVSLLSGYVVSEILMSTGYVVHNETAILVLTLAFAAIIYALMEKMLALGFSLLGAGLVYRGLLAAGVQPAFSLLVAVAVFILGFIVQTRG